MKKQVRGQSSVEFLVITGVGLLLLTTVSLFYLHYVQTSADQTRLQQVSSIGQTILQQAAIVNGWGSNSWKSVDVSMPDNVESIFIADNDAIVFNMTTQHGTVTQPVFTTMNLTGVTPAGSISYVTRNGLQIHPGLTTFQVTSVGNQIQIEATK